jgi:peptidoglycan hydrolase-like protein with peptidoglycan-binding domain
MTRPWQGIVGRGMSPAEFDTYVGNLAMREWHPRFCVVHNTGIPKFSEWHLVSGERRMKALENYYRYEAPNGPGRDPGWSAGPHVFVADDLIWPFTPLYTTGVHAPSWNGVAWGVEFVGDFNTEEIPPSLMANGLSALATLHRKGNLDPVTIKLHREDPLTSHKVCPGSRLTKMNIIAGVQRNLGHIPVPDPFIEFPVLKAGVDSPDAVAKLQRLLGMNNLGSAVGTFGPRTTEAVKQFQISQGLKADGIVGKETWRLLVSMQ